MHAKVQIEDIGPGRFVQAPKMGEIFYRDSVGTRVPKTYQTCTKKRAQNVPYGRRRDPENILK